ncbi:MAG TPA: acyltransferase [Isosphaeraceae bacterium]|jgi:peptidoglycan/LPS O-acetylase OafA/YrhL|nr:acyltransferase [Isosphaeraceae bacterium]
MKRVPELDALRGIAAVVIVLYHLRFMGRFPLWGTAVDLFFVLSGYLITTILLNTYRTEHFLRTFYIRRALRIWPAYYLYILAAVGLNRLMPHQQPTDGLIAHLTYTQLLPYYWGATPPACGSMFDHTWTLAIEEQFYLFWPLLVAVAGRRFLLWLAIPLLATPVVMRSWGFAGHLLLTRCDGLALGALLAALLFDRGRLERHRRAFIAGFALVATTSLSYPLWRVPAFAPAIGAWPGQNWPLIVFSIDRLRISLLFSAVVGMVLCGQGHRLLAPLRERTLCHLGQISYGLYLYHPVVFGAVGLVVYHAIGVRGALWLDGLKLVACVVVAKLSWTYFEQPLLALKERFAYQPEAIPTTPPAPVPLDSVLDATQPGDTRKWLTHKTVGAPTPSRTTLAGSGTTADANDRR